MAIDRNNILQKVRALSELADPTRNPSEGEVKAAARKMAQLMEQYNLSWAEVLQAKTERERKLEFVQCTSRSALGVIRPWHWSLAEVIAWITTTKRFATPTFGGASYRKASRQLRKAMSMSFFGGKEAAQLAADLFDEWVVLVDRMATEASGEYCRELTRDYGFKNPISSWGKIVIAAGLDDEGEPVLGPEDHPVVWRNSWLNGLISGMSHVIWEEQRPAREEAERVRKEQEAAAAEQRAATVASTALMVITNALEVAYEAKSKSFRKVHAGGSGRYNFGAHRAGYEKGSTIRVGAKKLGKGD